MKKEKKNKNRSSKNLKISTRITLSTIFGILIPLVIVSTFSSIFLNTMASYFNVSTVSSNSYSILNQFQWNQTISYISNELISEDNDADKLNKVTGFVSPLEKLGSIIYIECNSKEFYSTSSKNEVIKTANEIVSIDTNKNINYFSEDGIVIVSHAKKADKNYLFIIANTDYFVPDVTEGVAAQDFASRAFSRTGLIIILIILVFILSIVSLSFITSSTIVKPIKKLSQGANEIAKGNLDYVIDYKSTNEIGVTVESFNDMTKRLKESLEYQNEIEASRKEMIAGVAHDLRTPLTSVKGYVEGLMDGIADTPEKQERYLKTIYSSTKSMEKLLDELLTVSKLDTGNVVLDLQEININDFLLDCANNLRVELEEEGFDFVYNNNCSETATVLLDSDQFERVIRNIISNSVRYAKKDVKGRIEISAQEYQKNIIISIADNGIGMDAENIPKIFDFFYRADKARTKVNEGSGIGLSVCKQLVELHGGKIWATGSEGEGLTIYISLNKLNKELKNE